MATENMVKAGKAGLTFGGDWNEAVEYERLVGVRYDNKLFFSKKPVPIGLIPEDGEYWFLAYEGLTDAEWDAIINGTQQVGDSARLGGKSAEEWENKFESYSPREYIGVTEEEIDAIYASLHENAPNNTWYRARVQHNFAHSILGGGTFYVEGFRTTAKYGTQKTTSYKNNGGTKEFSRSLVNTVWNKWDSDLPLSGGVITGNAIDPVSINTSSSDARILMRFLNKSIVQGHLGFNGVNNPIFLDTSGKSNNLLHTGNKPTGSYNGNGDATARTISIGGVGKTVLVRKTGDSTNFAIVSENGYIGKQGNTVVVGEDAKTLYAGDLWVKSTSDLFNTSGASYYYEKL